VTDVRIDGDRLAADVAPADDAAGIIGNELRIAQTHVARDERGRLVDRKSLDEREKRPFAHDEVGDMPELLDVGERDRPDDDVGHRNLRSA